MIRSNYITNASPSFQVLSPSQIEDMHSSTLEVLRRTGVRVMLPEARELLAKAGCWIEGDIVRLPAHLVEWAIRTAPSRVALCDRNGKLAMDLTGHNTYFGTGSDTPNTIDPYTGQRRTARLQDVINFARLVDALPNLDFHMCMGIAQDLPQVTSDIHHFEAMLNNTTKPICYTTWDFENYKTVVEICEAVAGSAETFRRSPFAILYTEPISPLQHTIPGTAKLMYSARKGLPVVYTPGMSFGAVGPITSAGGLLVANAELLSGLVIAQLASEGAPFVYGGGVAILDMKTMGAAYGAPEFLINQAALCDLARYYQLPRFTHAGCSDAKTFDQQAALEGALWIMSQSLAGGNMAHDVGYIDSGLTSSMEMTVMSNEVIGMLRRYMQGIEVTDETKAIDVIDQVGPGGNYLAEKHTARHVRASVWMPLLIDRNNFTMWQAAGGKTYGDRANACVREILETHEPQPLPEDIRAAVRTLVEQADVRRQGQSNVTA